MQTQRAFTIFGASFQMGLRLFVCLAVSLVCRSAWAGNQAQKRGEVLFTGDKILKSKDLSGIDGPGHGPFLVLSADEGFTIQVLKRVSDTEYQAKEARNIQLATEQEGKELDIEAIAWGKKYVYAIGSHAIARQTVHAETWTAEQNTHRLQTLSIESTREGLYRFQLDDQGELIRPSLARISLKPLLSTETILRPFQMIPSKENGIDIEGLAVEGDQTLYIGFRGPVLRDNFVPVLLVSLADDNGEAAFVEKDPGLYHPVCQSGRARDPQHDEGGARGPHPRGSCRRWPRRLPTVFLGWGEHDSGNR